MHDNITYEFVPFRFDAAGVLTTTDSRDCQKLGREGCEL
jgi:hypothetical protein